MAKQVTRFQSNSGGLFDTEKEACQDDLRGYLRAALTDLDIAEMALRYIVAHPRPLADIMVGLTGKPTITNEIVEIAPKAAPLPPLPSGPNLNDATGLIPENVWWSDQLGDFVDVRMQSYGAAFTDKWFSRAGEFPNAKQLTG